MFVCGSSSGIPCCRFAPASPSLCEGEVSQSINDLSGPAATYSGFNSCPNPGRSETW